MNRRGNILVSVVLGVLVASLLGLTTDQIINNVYSSGSQALRVTLTGGAAATSITSGTTTIANGTDTSPCFQDGASPTGVINCGDTGWSWNKTTNALTATTFIGNLTGTASIAATGDSATSFFSTGTIEAARLGSGTPDNTNFLRGDGSWQVVSAGTVTGSGTAGLMPIWATATALGDSNAFPILVANAGATGTTVNKLAKFTSAGTAVITSAAETAGILGVVKGGAGTTGSAQIVTIGATSLVSDNATTAGHYATVSASTAGSGSDTGSSTFPVAGTQVIGIWTETGAAGTRTMFFGTPDISSASSGGGGGGVKNPAGAAGDVQYRASGNNFAAEAAFNYDATNNRLLLSGMTTATDNTTNMFKLSGTLPASPSTSAFGESHAITTAGNASQLQLGVLYNLLAGYTGSSATRGLQSSNGAAGTGATLNLGNTTGLVGNTAAYFATSANTAGINAGAVNYASGSSTGNIASLSQTASADSGYSIANLANAANSTNGNLRNVAYYGTLGSPSIINSALLNSVMMLDNGAVAGSIIRGYDNSVLVFDVADVTGTAVNGLQITGGATTVGPTLAAIGETNVPITLAAKGTGAVNITSGSSGIVHTGAATFNSTVRSSATADIGWSVVAGANTACNTTCTSACVVGFDITAAVVTAPLACTDATADTCICAGNS